MAFVRVVEAVRDEFRSRGITARVSAGWRERPGQTNQGGGTANRVVFTPSNPMRAIAPTHVGGSLERSRQLLNLLFSYDVSFWGYDAADGGSVELRHIARCINLFEATTQAIHRAYHGAYEWGSMRWTDSTIFLNQGAELVATLTLNVPIFDRDSLAVKPVSPVPIKP